MPKRTMPHPSFEGLTSKPVMPRTLVASYPDLEGYARVDLSDGWLSSLKHVVKPRKRPITAIEVMTGKVVELAIEGERPAGIMVTPGIWECHLELEMAGEEGYRPGFAVTDKGGNRIYLQYDRRNLLGVTQGRHALSFLFFVDTGEPERLLLHVATGNKIRGSFRDIRLSVKKIGSR